MNRKARPSRRAGQSKDDKVTCVFLSSRANRNEFARRGTLGEKISIRSAHHSRPRALARTKYAIATHLFRTRTRAIQETPPPRSAAERNDRQSDRRSEPTGRRRSDDFTRRSSDSYSHRFAVAAARRRVAWRRVARRRVESSRVVFFPSSRRGFNFNFNSTLETTDRVKEWKRSLTRRRVSRVDA